MRGGSGSLWDSDLIVGVAFKPRKCQPNSKKDSDGGGWHDGEFAAADGTKIAYRLYTAPNSQTAAKPVVLVYFHANAELCTDLEGEVGAFYRCGFQAVFCPEFRGFAWSGGKPRLSALGPDAEAAYEALPEAMRKAGYESTTTNVAVHGRSLGSCCAVHVAAKRGEAVSALVVESGVMSILELPMVRQLGSMMPEILQALMAEPKPLDTLAQMRQVKIPTLVIHGDRDEVSPVGQAVAGHRACGAGTKKLVRFPRAGHNDVRAVARKEYFSELELVAQVAASGGAQEALLQAEQQDDAGLLGFITGALRCFPGMRRCLSGHDDAQEERDH
mmetsp:Transcript_71153/g.201640  ORF Transcript_71153/g.201640 Transcript_71153/m.201640 type:complete len:330 (-) Transcript_71153:229-1218(-)